MLTQAGRLLGIFKTCALVTATEPWQCVCVYERYVCLVILHFVAQIIGSIKLVNGTLEKHYLSAYYLGGVAVLDIPL